jgi:hypothetical protein
MKSKKYLLGFIILFITFHSPTAWGRNKHFHHPPPADELHDVKLKWIKARKKIKFCKRLHKIPVILENKTKNPEIAQVALYKDGNEVARWTDVDLRQRQDRVLFYFYNPAEDAGNTVSWTAEIAIPFDENPSDNIFGPKKTKILCLGDGDECNDNNAEEVCDDGNACTEDHCVNGSCINTQIVCESDNNPCTIDECNPLSGDCYSPVEDGISCEDGNDCNGSETCQGGECIAGEPIVCESDCNPCTMDECNPQAGECENTPIVGCVIGDINGNGCVDPDDATCLLDYVNYVNCPEGETCPNPCIRRDTCDHCDIDQNCDANYDDVQCIYKWLIKIPSCLDGNTPSCSSECTPGATQPCYTGSPNTRNVGECKTGTQTCDAEGINWSLCEGDVTPTEEVCDDNLDNDCDRDIDGNDIDCNE